MVASCAVLMLVAGCSRDSGGDSLPIPEITATSTQAATTAPSTVASTVPPTSTAASSTAPTTAPATTSVAPPTIPTPTTTPVATAAPTTAPPTPACPALTPLPDGSVESASNLVDVDVDGVTDTVRTYATSASPGAGDWHVRVELASGGGSDLALADDPAPGQVAVLGGAYVGSNVEPGPQGPRPAIFVTTGAGASASVVSLFRLDGCELVPMTDATFVVGAGVTHAENLRCDGVAGTSVLAYQQIELNADGVTFDVTDTGYTRDGNALVVYGAGPQTSNQATFPDVATLIDCPGVDHP
jgi:hypothetical protein